MKVLFLMFVFPDMNKSFNMYTSLVEQFVKHGHKVVVVAPGQENTGIKTENSIEVLRVKTLPLKNVSNVLKGISNILLPFQFKKALSRFYPGEEFDLIITPTPPITLVDLASGIKKKDKSKFYLILRDIFPQNAVDMKFLSTKSPIYKYFRFKEKKLYQQADLIGCMSEGNVEYIKEHNPEVKAEKLKILRNFQKQYESSGIGKADIKNKFGLSNKFVVVFGGNMGKPQQLENVLELAKRCNVYPDVLFLLLGEGVQIEKLINKIRNNDYINIAIIDTIPKHEYQQLLSVCDLGLISLHRDFTIPNIPSKSLDYFNVGIPVLASVDSATDYGKILDHYQCGLVSVAGDHECFFKNFSSLYNNQELRNALGKNGNKYFQEFLTPDKAYNSIYNEFQQLIS